MPAAVILPPGPSSHLPRTDLPRGSLSHDHYLAKDRVHESALRNIDRRVEWIPGREPSLDNLSNGRGRTKHRWSTVKLREPDDKSEAMLSYAAFDAAYGTHLDERQQPIVDKNRASLTCDGPRITDYDLLEARYRSMLQPIVKPTVGPTEQRQGAFDGPKVAITTDAASCIIKPSEVDYNKVVDEAGKATEPADETKRHERSPPPRRHRRKASGKARNNGKIKVNKYKATNIRNIPTFTGDIRQLLVRNLSCNVDDDWLCSEFEKFGTIIGCFIVDDHEYGGDKGYIEFQSADAAATAQEEMDGYVLDGLTLSVTFSAPRYISPYWSSAEASDPGTAASTSSVPDLGSDEETDCDWPVRTPQDSSEVTDVPSPMRAADECLPRKDSKDKLREIRELLDKKAAEHGVTLPSKEQWAQYLRRWPAGEPSTRAPTPRSMASEVNSEQSFEDALRILNLQRYRSVDHATLEHCLCNALRGYPEISNQLVAAFTTISEYQDKHEWGLRLRWNHDLDARLLEFLEQGVNFGATNREAHLAAVKLNTMPDDCYERAKHLRSPSSGWTKEEDSKLLNMKTANASWADICKSLKKERGTCKKRFKEIRPADWVPHGGKPKGSAKKSIGKKEDPTSTAELNSEDRPQGQPSTERDLLACLQPSGSSQRFTPLYTPWTVTYTATIECGTSKIQVPIAGNDVSGLEKTIITDGLPKIWKWVHDKSLKDSVSLQAAFDLAHSMHEDESDEGSSQTSDCRPVSGRFDGNSCWRFG